jgi:DNA-binding NarL/FixJ family response regulator
MRLGLRSLFASRHDWDICGEASDGRSAIDMCRSLKPDLVVLDIAMPHLNGVDAARQILKDNPTQRILVLTDVDREDVIRHCLEAGVRGWVSKSDATDDVTMSVEAIRRHKCIFSARVQSLIERQYLQRDRVRPVPPKIPDLSIREREVVQLVAEGNSTKQVAAILNVTVKTADTHRSNVMKKLRLHSVAELVMYAVRNGIVHIDPPSLEDGMPAAAVECPPPPARQPAGLRRINLPA